jgi:hypothetical protein
MYSLFIKYNRTLLTAHAVTCNAAVDCAYLWLLYDSNVMVANKKETPLHLSIHDSSESQVSPHQQLYPFHSIPFIYEMKLTSFQS